MYTLCFSFCEYPSLWRTIFRDGTLPSMKKFKSALVLIKSEYNNMHLKQNNSDSLFIHCAYGVGRSASLLCAALVDNNIFEHWQDALHHIKYKRPMVALNARHKTLLNKWFTEYLALKTKRKWLYIHIHVDVCAQHCKFWID